MTFYKLLDSGDGEKLEQFGPYTLIRPAVGALWRPSLSKSIWDKAHARFSRTGQNQWQLFKPIADSWEIVLENVRLQLKRTDFGHLGVFPEHARLWPWMQTQLKSNSTVLNLFAYSGGASLFLASQGHRVTHLDSAKGMVTWAKENADLNGLKNSIRWIVDDVRKYLQRAWRRQESYDAIILDPPSFGRGAAGEIFKIEFELYTMLQACRSLLSSNASFLLVSCHTPGITPIALKQMMRQIFSNGSIEAAEMYIDGTFSLPSGTFARWTP